MDIIWLDRARREVIHIRKYIAMDNPRVAQQVARRILEISKKLRATPNIGRPGRLYGTRELVITGTPFIILYRVRDGVIEFLRVIHAARRWPDSV
jgi:toxin ParE1/3/4